MSLTTTVQEILDRGVADGDVAGAVAMIIGPDDTVAEAAAGERTLGSGQPMTLDTVCWIASMTKAVTGTAAMQLVEQGRLDLDAPASDVIPALGDVEVLDGFDAAGQPLTRPRKGEITLRNLLTHTAGFGYDIWSEDLVRYNEATGTPNITSCEDRALTTPLVNDPGKRWLYGINIDYVGKMVEAVSGQKLGAYFRQHIFEPLGMTSTAFKITDDMRERLAGMHTRTEDGGLEPMEFEIPQDPEFEMGGGGLYSTVVDYCEFLRMFLNHGAVGEERILRPETVDQMTANNMGDIRVEKLHSAIPPYSNDAEFFPGLDKAWGLTFEINTEPAPTGRPAGGVSWAGLANSFYWIDIQNQVAGAYISQLVPFADPRSYQLYYDIESATYDNLTPA